MAHLVGGDEAEPFISIQRAKKRMPPAILGKITASGFLDECQGSFTDMAEFGEHLLFFADQLQVQRHGSIAADQALFDESKREVKSLQERDGLRGMLQDAIGFGDNGALDTNKVRDQLGGAPDAMAMADFPMIRRDGVGGAQQIPLSARELPDEGFEVRHR